MNFYKRMPLQRKVLLTYVTLVLLLLTVVFAVLSVKTNGDANARYEGMLYQAGEQIGEKITATMEDVRYTSTVYLLGSDMADYLANDFYINRKEYVETLREMRKNTLSVRINPNLSSITYLTMSGALYSGAGYNEQYLATLNALAERMQAENVKTLVSPIYDTTISQQQTSTITYAFRLTSPYTFKQVGYGFLNLDMKRLAQSFRVLSLNESIGSLAVQDGRAYFADGADAALANAVARVVSDEPSSERRSLTVASAGEAYLCAVQWCDELGLSIVSYVGLDAIHAGAEATIYIYLFTVALMLLVFALLSVVMAASVTKPFRILKGGMARVEQGRLEPIAEQADRPDDMGELIRGFNRMVQRLRESILREYESRDMERQSQIKLLQSQINPHFLYNALNLIASIGELEDVPEIPQISTDLADLFRYNISGAPVVQLKEEIAQVERYISIQRRCMAGSVQAVYCVSPEAAERDVLKFLLQPLVENSFAHGFGKTIADFRLELDAAVDAAGDLCLTVRDNGAGMPPEQLAALRAQCAESRYDPRGGSIGLINVNFRLKAAYGEDCGLTIDSEEGVGTRVAMRLPRKEG